MATKRRPKRKPLAASTVQRRRLQRTAAFEEQQGQQSTANGQLGLSDASWQLIFRLVGAGWQLPVASTCHHFEHLYTSTHPPRRHTVLACMDSSPSLLAWAQDSGHCAIADPRQLTAAVCVAHSGTPAMLLDLRARRFKITGRRVMGAAAEGGNVRVLDFLQQQHELGPFDGLHLYECAARGGSVAGLQWCYDHAFVDKLWGRGGGGERAALVRLTRTASSPLRPLVELAITHDRTEALRWWWTTA
jgi:hypothetical protein